MYYRYELWVEDEFQDIGFLQGLDDTGLEAWKTNELIEPFYELPIPEHVFKQGRTKSYFTEQGNDHFASAIQAVVDAYTEDGLFDVECICLNELPGNIAYQDKWQVLVWSN